MESNHVWFGVAVGLGCGLCIGWITKSKFLPKVALPAGGGDLMGETASDGGRAENKLVLVVRSDLKMGKGKIAAQCSHASVMAYESLARSNPELLQKWRRHGQPKIVVKTDDETSLMELAKHARSLGLTASIVRDAGRTQIAPDTKTVLGVGPGPGPMVDAVTKHLKLL